MPAGQDSALPVTTTCGLEPRVSWTPHTLALTVLPRPLWGPQGQPFASTIPLYTRETLAEQRDQAQESSLQLCR